MVITVPRGFITDLASIPRALWNLPFTDPNGVSRRPACLHDALYALGRSAGKAFADDALRRAMLSEGASPFVAGMFYKAVHYFGKGSYASDFRSSDLGICSGDFIDGVAWKAWKDAGGTIFS